MKLKRELGIATLANWGGAFTNYLIAFLATPIIVYSFGDIRYGIWSLAMSLTAYYGMLDFGINTTIVKYYAEYIEKNDKRSAVKIINAAFFTYLVITVLLLVAVLVLSFNVENIFNIPKELIRETKYLLCITGLTIGIELIGNTFRAVVTGLKKFVLRNSLMGGFSIVRTLSIIIILKMGYGLIFAGITVLCIDLLRNIMFAFCAYRLSPFLKISYKQFDKFIIKNSVGFTFYNLLRNVSTRIVERSDLILVGIFFDMKTTALYSIGESLVRYIQMIPKGLRGTILPFSSQLNVSSKQNELKKMAYFLPKYTVTFFLGVLLLMTLFGREFIYLWMGPGYEVSYEIVVILLLSKTLFMSQSLLVHLLTGMGYNKYYGILAVVEVGLKIGISILLLKQFGVHGIALGSLFTFLITSVILVPSYALKMVNLDKIHYYSNVLIKPFALIIIIYIINIKIATSLYWFPVVMIEYFIFYYIFIWDEVNIRKKVMWNFSL